MKKFKFIKAPTNDFFLRIYAVIFAILIWFVVSITLYPTITKTISNISVSPIKTEGTLANDYNLSAVHISEEKVSATIFGKRYDIGDLSSDDLEAVVDIANVIKPGEYNLDLKIVSKHKKNMEVKDISPKTVKVTFDSIVEKDFPVVIEAPDIAANDGYLMEPITCNPESIKISGPKEEMDKVTKVVVRTDEKDKLTESQTISSSNLFLYNGQTVLDKSHFTFSTDKVQLRVPILMEKKLPLKLDIQNAPPGFDISALKYKFSDNDISIAAPAASLSTLGEIHLGYLNLSQVDINSSFNYNISLPDSYKNLSGIEKVSVDFNWDYYSSKTISLDKSKIYIINSSAKYNYNIKTNKITNIKIIGPKSVINSISDNNIIAELDLLDQELSESSYVKNVRIYSPDFNNVWAYGEYNVALDVTAK